jgi:hypothetical protein
VAVADLACDSPPIKESPQPRIFPTPTNDGIPYDIVGGTSLLLKR